jgi:hypothetical protein
MQARQLLFDSKDIARLNFIREPELILPGLYSRIEKRWFPLDRQATFRAIIGLRPHGLTDCGRRGGLAAKEKKVEFLS